MIEKHYLNGMREVKYFVLPQLKRVSDLYSLRR